MHTQQSGIHKNFTSIWGYRITVRINEFGKTCIFFLFPIKGYRFSIQPSFFFFSIHSFIKKKQRPLLSCLLVPLYAAFLGLPQYSNIKVIQGWKLVGQPHGITVQALTGLQSVAYEPNNSAMA